MKLKRIKDNEIIVDKYEYEKLVKLENILLSAEKSILFGVNPIFYKSIELEKDYVSVFMSIDGFRVRIKCFNSNDFEYNLLCAKELVELLNEEQ